MRLLRTVSEIVDKIMAVVASVCLLGFTVVMLIQVVQRNFFPKYAWAFADALCRYMFIWATFSGISMVSKRRKQINITLIPDLLKGIPQKLLTLFNSGVFIVIMGFCVYWGTYAAAANATQSLDSVPFSAAWVYAAIPVGCFATLIQEIVNLAEDIYSWRKEKPV